MNLILFDDPSIRIELFPFTFTRPVGALRVGILTLAEKWEKYLGTTASFKTEPYLQKKYPAISTTDNLLVNGALCPDDLLAATVKSLPEGYFLVKGSLLLAARNPVQEMNQQNTIEYREPLTIIDKPWKIFRENGAQIRADFKKITAGRTSAGISDPHTIVYGKENIFVEEGVSMRAATLNAENGPIYLGKNSQLHEGALIRGAFALCEGSQINMGAKVRGDVTVGPFSKVGGEISNSVIIAYSNKAHDGFLGNSVVGEWCNIGADSNTSNLKNNYDLIKLWRHKEQDYVQTELYFCGLMMGDHSKCSINTMFNTATVVDVSASVFGEGFPPNYVPSFSWGGGAGLTTYQVDKALETAARVVGRRDQALSDIDKEILLHVYNTTAHSRTWEKK